MRGLNSSSASFSGEIRAEADNENPVREHFRELARAQEHSVNLLNQVEAKLLVEQPSGEPKAQLTAPGFSTELRNTLQGRIEAAVALNGRLQDLLERI